MEIFRGLESLPLKPGSVGTVGSFDGVHLAHQLLLERTVSIARERGTNSVVFTFEPHPRVVLTEAEGLELLSTLEEKVSLLDQAGVDVLVIIPFTKEFSHTSSEDFIALLKAAGISTLVAGFNHRFGNNNEGSGKSASGMIEVVEVEEFTVGHCKVSSTMIRSLIRQGAFSGVEKLLGHPYLIIGHSDEEGVVECDKLKLLPPEGIYPAVVNGRQVSVDILEGKKIHTGVPSGFVTILL